MATVLKILLKDNSVEIWEATEADAKKEHWTKFLSELEEQKEYQIQFLIDENSREARLYMPGLDIPIQRENGDVPAPPDSYGWNRDGYRKPGKRAFWLVQHDDDYDALRVDTYDIRIESGSQVYSRPIKVIPNKGLMEKTQWEIMRDEVEREYADLARDIVRQSLGFKEIASERLPAEKLYRFQVFRNYNSNMLAALMGIQKAPKSKIVTRYQELPAGSSCRTDPKSIQMTAISGKRKNCVYVPQKHISFDIPENRLLKKIIEIYDRELSDFWALIDEAQKKAADKSSFTHKQTWYELENFKTITESLRKTGYVIKSQPWYQEINSATAEQFPHSFVMDPRYGTLFRLYRDLRKENIGSSYEKQHYFSWKASHELYEMWCFITLCRALIEEDSWELVGSSLTYETTSVFPTLKPGTKLTFVGNRSKTSGEKDTEELRIDVIYNGEVGVNRVKNENDPFYFTRGNHKLPDIRIDLYTYLPDAGQEKNELAKKPNQYWGTLIFECKYRTLKGIWDSKYHNREQIQDYYTAAHTDWDYHAGVKRHKFFQTVYKQATYPTSVKRVIVLTPDTSLRGTTLNNPVPEYVDFLPLKAADPDGISCKDKLNEIVNGFVNQQLDSGCYWTKNKQLDSDIEQDQ